MGGSTPEEPLAEQVAPKVPDRETGILAPMPIGNAEGTGMGGVGFPCGSPWCDELG